MFPTDENALAPGSEVELDEVELDPEEQGDDDSVSMSEPFDPEDIRIQVAQVSLDSLITRLRHGEIDMETDFQREADLWDNAKMSRLIESLLIRFPLPAFYFDAAVDDKWLVVDGLQRLSAIRKFVPMHKGGKGELALTGLEFLKDLKGKRFADLPRKYQRRISEQQVTTYLIAPGTPEEVKYSVFRRINTGGLTLNYQEIRHAMASPRERNFLNELAKDEHFVKTMGKQSRRMTGQELVLRALAFSERQFVESKTSIAKFLDEQLSRLKECSDAELASLAAAFRGATRAAWQLFNTDAFQKRSPTGRRIRKNSVLFEVWMVWLIDLVTNDADKLGRLLERKDDVRRGALRLLEVPEFVEAISIATQKRQNVEIRYRMVGALINEVAGA